MIIKYFWRRSFAFLIDLLICGILATAVVILLNWTVSSNILAPSLIPFQKCAAGVELISKERMNQLLPLEQGQRHQQVICKRINTPTTSFYVTKLQKIWKVENTNVVVSISYYSDKYGKEMTYIQSDPFVYLLAPLFFAILIARYGQTPGKRILGLIVDTDAFVKPDFKSALKREYLKAIFFVLGSLNGFYAMFWLMTLDIEKEASKLNAMASDLDTGSFAIAMALGFTAFVIVVWFQFGSFIRWRGRTYWDRFASLNTNAVRELQKSKNLSE